MRITEIGERHCKMGKTSITVKDERDKTCGIVRDVRKIGRDAPCRERFDFREKYHVRDHDVVWEDGTYYKIARGHRLSHVEKYGFFNDDEKRHYDEYLAELEAARAAGLTVLRLNIDWPEE